MSVLTIDPVAGFQRSPDGRDLRFLRREKQPREWCLAIARAVFWQIKGQWKFDQSKGIDYVRIFDRVPDRRFVQAEFYRELSRFFRVRSISVTQPNEEDIAVTFVADLGDGQVVGPLSVSFADREADRDPVRLISGSYSEERIALYFDRVLNRHLVPEIESFEIIGSEATITAVEIRGSHAYLTTSEAVEGSVRLVYRPRETPAESVNRERVAGFVFEFEGDEPAPDPPVEIYMGFVAPAPSFSALIENQDPTRFAELRSWWEAEDSPSNGSAADWPARAGTQATALPRQGTQTSSRTTTAFPRSGAVGQQSGYLVTNPEWSTTDGITYFIVTLIQAGGSVAFAQANYTPPTPRHFSMLSNVGPVLQFAKADGSPVTVLSTTGLNGVPISWVVSIASGSNVVRVAYKISGGALTSAEYSTAGSFGTPTGHSINFAQGGLPYWGQSTGRAGVVGELLSSDDAAGLCARNAVAFGF